MVKLELAAYDQSRLDTQSGETVLNRISQGLDMHSIGEQWIMEMVYSVLHNTCEAQGYSSFLSCLRSLKTGDVRHYTLPSRCL